MAQIATVLLTHQPSNSRLSKIAYHIATTFFKGHNYGFTVLREAPDGIDTDEYIYLSRELAKDSDKVILVVQTED